jgi:prevent-host-death family protein
MKVVNIQAAKTHLSRLVEEARSGSDIVLAKAGRAMVRLVPVTSNDEGARPSGQWVGKGFIADDFDAPCPAISALFHGTAAAASVQEKPTKRTRKRAE